jgi:hypothetical protein
MIFKTIFLEKVHLQHCTRLVHYCRYTVLVYIIQRVSLQNNRVPYTLNSVFFYVLPEEAGFDI